MNFRQKYRLDAMRRGQGFLDTNTAVLGSINSSGARAELDDAVAQLTAEGNNQAATRVGAQGTTSQVGALRNTLRQGHMRPIAQVAKARLSTVPQFSALTLPDPMRHQCYSMGLSLPVSGWRFRTPPSDSALDAAVAAVLSGGKPQ